MSKLRHIQKVLGKWIWIPFVKYYLSSDRSVKVGDIRLTIPTGVFHPTIFFSTKLLLSYINNQPIENLKVLELGAGSGLISVAMAKRGAIVTASDINKLACDAIQENALKNNVPIEIIHSDMFENFPNIYFDIIVINPPYYPRNPVNNIEKAWFCGENFDFFHKLFSQLNGFIKKSSQVIMVLSEDCNIEKINALANHYGYSWLQIEKRRINLEWNYLYAVSRYFTS